MADTTTPESSPSNTENQVKRFYRLWCLKESMIKALNAQSDFDLKTIEFTIQDEEETEKVQCSSTLLPSLPLQFDFHQKSSCEEQCMRVPPPFIGDLTFA